jgi:putative restriction endonuclease
MILWRRIVNRKLRSHHGSPLDLAHDARVRAAAFAWLTEQVSRLGTDVLPHSLLAQGFQFAGERVPLFAPQGIFKPKVLSGAPLSIRTAYGGPYDDAFGRDNLLRYRYRGTDPNHPDNVGLPPRHCAGEVRGGVAGLRRRG